MHLKTYHHTLTHLQTVNHTHTSRRETSASPHVDGWKNTMMKKSLSLLLERKPTERAMAARFAQIMCIYMYIIYDGIGGYPSSWKNSSVASVRLLFAHSLIYQCVRVRQKIKLERCFCCYGYGVWSFLRLIKKERSWGHSLFLCSVLK